jgi:NADH dehydrogenase
VRQAKVLADNILRELRGKPVFPYEHKYAGSVASLGLYKGVAEIYGVKLRGYPAWFMHRTYHMSRVPTFNRKIRVIADWTLALFLKREVVSLGQLHDPRVSFEEVAVPAPDRVKAAEPAKHGAAEPAKGGEPAKAAR